MATIDQTDVSEHLFVDSRIVMDGKRFTRCTFSGCVLVCRDGSGSRERLRYEDCLFVGDGWAPWIKTSGSWLADG